MQVRVRTQDVEHGTRNVHLLGRRLTARHIQGEAAGLDLFNLGTQGLNGLSQGVRIHLLIHRLHDEPFDRARGGHEHCTRPGANT